MSRLRFATGAPKLTYRPGFCSLCGDAVPKGRKTWCSTACVEAWQLATDVGMQRRHLFQRDRGVCALCGTDAHTLREVTRRQTRGLGIWRADRVKETYFARGLVMPVAVAFAVQRGFPFVRMTWWDADHIVPLVEGGHPGIENLRTLCNPCHKAETASLARRRAVARRGPPGRELFGEGATA